MPRLSLKPEHRASADSLLRRLRRLTRRDDDECLENFFTECMAAALNDDQWLARKVLREICDSPRVGGISINTAEVSVYRQVALPTSGVADMILEARAPGSQRVAQVILEHKLAAKLGVGQLDKYLASHATFVVAVSRHNLAIPPVYTEREDGRYRYPSYRDHFMWPDFFPIVAEAAKRKGARTLSKALLGLFEDLKFEPPSKEIGRLRHRGTSKDETIRRAFAKKWPRTSLALKKGWKRIHPGSQAQLYIEEPRSTGRLTYVMLDPLAPNNMLRVRLNCRSVRAQHQIVEDLERGRASKRDSRVIQRMLKRTHGDEPVVDVEIPLRNLAPAGSTSDEHEANICSFVVPIVKKAHRLRTS